jgi:hypothetical protein
MSIKAIVDRVFYTKLGQFFISCLFGISLALLFKRVCKDNCTIYIAPKNENIKDKVFKLEDTCYKYKTVQVKCSETNKPVMFYDGYEKPENLIEEPSFLSKVFS